MLLLVMVIQMRRANAAVVVAPGRPKALVATRMAAGAIPAIDNSPMRELVTAYLGLGANLGKPAAALALAIQQLGAYPGIAVTAQSSYYRTAPLDSSGPDYTNAVVEVRTSLTAPELLSCLQSIESAAGRERPYRNAPRTLDLDILLYGDAQVSSPALDIPHIRMWQRAFVLLPLVEIAPQRVSAEQLLAVRAQAISRIEASPN